MLPKTEVSSDSQSLGDTAAGKVCIKNNTTFETATRNGFTEMAQFHVDVGRYGRADSARELQPLPATASGETNQIQKSRQSFEGHQRCSDWEWWSKNFGLVQRHAHDNKLLAFSRQIFKKYTNIIFHKYPSQGTRVIPRVRTDRQTDVTNYLYNFSQTHLCIIVKLCI